MMVYHLRPWEISKLTDRQIHELYYHPREEDGSIKPVETVQNREPRTLQEALIQYECLAVNVRTPREVIEQNKEKLRKRWEANG